MKYKIQELSLVDGDKYIFGQLYLPDDERKEYPTVILCHGYGVNHMALADFAELLAEAGIAAYTFDFCGGGFLSCSIIDDFFRHSSNSGFFCFGPLLMIPSIIP